jgi:tetratricopeptide (TPR) repeat protein
MRLKISLAIFSLLIANSLNAASAQEAKSAVLETGNSTLLAQAGGTGQSTPADPSGGLAPINTGEPAPTGLAPIGPIDVPVGGVPAMPIEQPPPPEPTPVEKPPEKPAPPPTVAPYKDFSPQSDEKAQRFRAELHAKKGSEMMKSNNFRQAESEYKEASKIQPDDLSYLENYADAAHKSNDWREVIDAYTRLLKQDGAHHPESHAILGEAYFKMHRYDEACDAYKKAVQFEKDKGAMWYKVAEIRLIQAKQPEAMEAYRGVIKVAPSDGKAYKLLASMLWNNNSKAEALRIYKAGSVAASKDGDLLAAYGYALMSEQQYREAAAMYKAAAGVKGATPDIDAGYKSALEHINYEEQQAAIKAQKELKDKKKHH